MNRYLIINWEDAGVFKVVENEKDLEEYLAMVDQNVVDVLMLCPPARPLPPEGEGQLTIHRLTVREVEQEEPEEDEVELEEPALTEFEIAGWERVG